MKGKGKEFIASDWQTACVSIHAPRVKSVHLIPPPKTIACFNAIEEGGK